MNEGDEDLDILIKVSGDLIENDKLYQWISHINKNFQKDRFFILCGGGSAISNILEQHKIPYNFEKAGREIGTTEGKYLAKKVLKRQKFIVEQKLFDLGINAKVIVPMIEFENKICHMNGDNFVISLYPNFDKIFVVTLNGRTKTFPEDLKKITIIYL